MYWASREDISFDGIEFNWAAVTTGDHFFTGWDTTGGFGGGASVIGTTRGSTRVFVGLFELRTPEDCISTELQYILTTVMLDCLSVFI